MEKIDYKKEFKSLYKASAKECALVDVPDMNFLMVDGKGDPNTSKEFTDAIEALYPISYTLKFMSKEKGIDYVVMPLQGLWYIDNMEEWSQEEKNKWQWTLMIMQPDHISTKMVDMAIEKVAKKKNPPALSKVRFEAYKEGLSVQILHMGPYSEETENIQKLHHFAEDEGYVLRGKHHEIYLSDARKTAPEKLKTIIRQPVAKK
jgi:hypothetical protein